MFSFKGFQTQDKNTHLEHLEDDIINRGATGGENAVNFLKAVRNMLAGSGKGTNMTVKWDGAPAIICGVNPENGKFFVGTKSIFNINPKFNYTDQDVDLNHGNAPGLADKLKKALKYLPELGIKNILQGDFMFDDSMVKSTTIDGKPHLTFRPNTITYAVESDSELGKDIAAAKIGSILLK